MQRPSAKKERSKVKCAAVNKESEEGEELFLCKPCAEEMKQGNFRTVKKFSMQIMLVLQSSTLTNSEVIYFCQTARSVSLRLLFPCGGQKWKKATDDLKIFLFN